MATVLTQVGEEWIVDMLDGGSVGTQYIGWGTGAGTAAKGDTALFTEASETRQAATRSQPAADKLRYVGTMTADATKTITNSGVLTLVSGGVLIIHGDFTGIPLNQNDQIQFTIDMEIT